MSTTTPLTPLKIFSRLAPTPKQKPKYAVNVKNAQGSTLSLGDPTVTRALVALMDGHAVNGGAACHWGGPAAFAEIMSAIHGLLFSPGNSSHGQQEWYERFNFVNDAGHTENGIYALRTNLGYDNLRFEDLWGFRSITGPFTGHGESHVYPRGVLLSNGPLSSALPQAQGLAAADKAIGLDRVTLCTISDGACMEGEAKESFASIPGLAARGKLNPFVLILSDNNTKLTGRIDQDSFSMTPSFNSMETLGWKVFQSSRGHDLQEVFSLIEKGVEEARKYPERPVFLHFKTIKGYGVQSTEDSLSGGHGFPLKKHDPQIVKFIDEIFKGKVPDEFQQMTDLLYQKALQTSSPSATSTTPTSSIKKEKAQAGLSRGAEKAALEGLPVFSISSDLQGSTGIAPFQKRFPERFIDIGVAEANMISMAAGLSKQGLIPIVDTFAQFGVTKGNLPLTMSSLSQAPVVAIFSHTGFQDAADGASHQASTYFAATSSIPSTSVVCCSCSQEAESFMYQALQRIKKDREKGLDGESVIFFVGREDFPPHYKEDLTYDWGKAQILYRPPQGKADVLLVTCGPLVKKALDSIPLLQKTGIQPLIVNNPFINRPDLPTIAQCLEEARGRLITLEDHQIIGGMGSLLSHALLREGHTLHLKSLGIKGHFGRSAYTADQLYDQYGLGVIDILQAAKELLVF